MITFDVDQAGWGSWFSYPDGTKQPWVPDKWVLHWGGGKTPVVNPVGTLRAWQRYHVNVKGWQDLAYNYAIDQDGIVYRIRGENRSGATAGDFENDGIPENHEARAVVFLVNIGQEPSGAALDAFRQMWAEDPMPVIGHGQVAQEGTGGTPTSCPGPDLRAFIASDSYATVMAFTQEQIATLKRIADSLTDDQIQALAGIAGAVEDQESDPYGWAWASIDNIRNHRAGGSLAPEARTPG